MFPISKIETTSKYKPYLHARIKHVFEINVNAVLHPTSLILVSLSKCRVYLSISGVLLVTSFWNLQRQSVYSLSLYKYITGV